MLDSFKQSFNESVISLNKYTEGDFGSNFLRAVGYKLTVKREALAKKFSDDMESVFKSDLKPEEKIDCIKQLTDAYIEDNNSYAQRYGKEQNSGKLGQVFCLFKNKINEIEAQNKTGEELSPETVSSYKNLF